MSDTVLLSITRYDPEKHSEPVFQSYTVPYHEDWVVLDALNHIKDNLDGTLRACPSITAPTGVGYPDERGLIV